MHKTANRKGNKLKKVLGLGKVVLPNPRNPVTFKEEKEEKSCGPQKTLKRLEETLVAGKTS